MAKFGIRRRIIVTEAESDVTVVNFVDKMILDETGIIHLGEQLSALADGPRKILCNFSNVEYLHNDALGKLITLRKSVLVVEGSLRLCCIRPRIKEVFIITKLNKLFDIFDTEQEALRDW